jgi:hypothetical protein
MHLSNGLIEGEGLSEVIELLKRGLLQGRRVFSGCRRKRREEEKRGLTGNLYRFLIPS